MWVRLYPYDVAPNNDTTGDGMADERSLRGSMMLLQNVSREDIQKRVTDAGIEVIEARITYLKGALQKLQSMLQRQQAGAGSRSARAMIVDGAVV